MRLLLSRGAIAWTILLIPIGVVQAAPRQPMPVAASDATPTIHRWISEPVAARVVIPVPSIPPAAAIAQHALVPRRAARVVRAAAASKPQGPAVVSSGSGQFALINQDRASAGLPPLQWNACLANIAVGQATRMAAQGFISHANGRTLDLGCHLGTFASESIGVQWGSINDAAMNAWFMNDPIHRDNIMGPYHYVGAAWVWGGKSAYLAIEFG